MVEILRVDCPVARGSRSAAAPASRRNLTPGPPHEDECGAADFAATSGGKTSAMKLDSGSATREVSGDETAIQAVESSMALLIYLAESPLVPAMRQNRPLS
jgi:hypothetical protein